MELAALDSAAMQTLDVAKLRKFREAAGLNQAEAAGRAAMTPARWNDIESGRRINVTMETLDTLARAIRCDARELITAPRRRKP